ncbi:hypothetical protein EDB81DRAFT_789811 [Dactylonectria macrodidyma]|uniref:Zn(2)-C6 fungal-type domain-containing protein n=1 Tax=Dactylonectria macrodidyma TaxID=307937 RepID=A0A9P9J6C7_9HYPO|nr:hypothetical protein EDB81DRAFT_789811 [Dactylonectria macrodidyma]
MESGRLPRIHPNDTQLGVPLLSPQHFHPESYETELDIPYTTPTLDQHHDTNKPGAVIEESVHALGKRRRSRATSDYTRRKRTPVACQFCRLRKSKCDNVRPSCSFCLQHQARCVYGDVAAPEPESFSAGQRVIMEQLEEIKELVQQNRCQNLPTNCGIDLATPSSTPGTSPATVQSGSWRGVGNPISQQHQEKDWLRPSSLQRTSLTAFRCESFLKWPVFRFINQSGIAQLKSFVSGTDSRSTQASEEERVRKGMNRVGEGIPEHAFVPLCHKFLVHFHPRNPVLDGEQLMRHARAVEEHGLTWDSASCLVLLACALAACTEPWFAPPEYSYEMENMEIPNPPSETETGADAYFLAAKMRLGLVGYGLEDIQCLLLACIYEKSFLRPLQAWFCIQQAATRLQARLQQSRDKPRNAKHEGPVNNVHLEQRIFWSCYRAERELLLELDMPSSGLDGMLYPDPLPEPPPYFSDREHDDDRLGPPNPNQALVEERGWCYYLAEISLRRTLDDNLYFLYERGENHWLQDTSRLLNQYYQAAEQRSMWYYYLPAVVKFDEAQRADNQFAHGLQGRFLDWHELTLRPILYYILHTSPGSAVSPNHLQLAEKALGVCVTLIVHLYPLRRHGGTWFILRRIFSCSCIVLGVVLHQARLIAPPRNWRSIIEAALRALKAWGNEASDISEMAVTLNCMYQETCRLADQSLR